MARTPDTKLARQEKKAKADAAQQDALMREMQFVSPAILIENVERVVQS